MPGAWKDVCLLEVVGCFWKILPVQKIEQKFPCFGFGPLPLRCCVVCGVFHFFGSDQLQEKDFPSPFSTESHFGMMTQVTAERHRCRQMPHWFGCREGARGDK
jgi:hypothetical protein